jgi:hypothetical protein
MQVIAERRVTEENFNGADVWTHAEQGERGEIVHVGDEGEVTVLWERTGTATLVSLDDEVRLVLSLSTATPRRSQ